MKDKEFLAWLHTRLEVVHKEDPLVDYMHKLRAIIKGCPAHKITLAIDGSNSLDDLSNLVKHAETPRTGPLLCEAESCGGVAAAFMVQGKLYCEAHTAANMYIRKSSIPECSACAASLASGDPAYRLAVHELETFCSVKCAAKWAAQRAAQGDPTA